MTYKNESSLISIIKFTPLVFIITISIVITIFLYLEKQNELEKEKISTRNEFINTNKELVKLEVENLYDFIIRTQEKTEEKLKENIKNRIYEAHNIAMRIYNENKNSKTKQEITKMIKDALVDIRFNDGRGYFFIYSFDYECILLPINRENEGKSVRDFQDSRGMYLGREIVKSLEKSKESFLTWYYPKPNDLKNPDFKKIGFNIHFEPYNWFIGTGEYFIDFEENMKKEVLEYISKLKTNENNYFFILDYKNRTLFQKIDYLVTKSFQKIELEREIKLFDNIVKNIQKNENFISYNYKFTDNDDFLIKTSYVKELKNWNWIIGKGFYHDYLNAIIEKKTQELNNKFHKKIINLISTAVILTIILLIISIYISKILDKKFISYKKEIDKYIKENTKQQHILSQQSKMAAMGEMLGNIAHQWRQPLSVITTVATGMKLQKEFNTLDDKVFNESIENITNSAQYLSNTIDDFRNFFKTDKEENSFNINDIFEKVFKLIKVSFKNHEIQFIKEIDNFDIFGLENEFIQALINILNNSKDALIEKSNPRLIFINAYKNKNKIIIKIKDNAGGIDEKIIDKICEPYFTTKHQSQGTGIGLFMTEEIIVKHMKGSLNVSNVELIYEGKTYKGLETTIKFQNIIY